MGLKSILFALIVFSALAGCGGGGKKGAPSSTVTNYPNLEELQAALDNQTVWCGEEREVCPGFSAKLTFWGKKDEDNYYLGVCSGSLYDGKYIITNSHCIPEELKKGGDCSHQLKVLFPRTDRYPHQSARCARIIQAYDQTRGGPDIAVLELDHVMDRESVTLAPHTFSESAKVTAFTMNPYGYDKNIGMIYKKSCTLSIDNMYTMTQDPRAKEAILYGPQCHMINGNSGSGLLNQNGEMIAVVFARVVEESLNEIFRKFGIYSKDMFPMGVAQNIGCIKDVTKSSGIGCNMREYTLSDLGKAIERSVQEHSLKGVSPAEIEYSLMPGFKLSLRQTPYPLPRRSLEDFKQNWERLLKAEGISQRSQELYEQ